VRITYNKQAQAVYIYVSEDTPVGFTEEIDGHDWLMVDKDAQGKVVGIEIMGVDEPPVVDLNWMPEEAADA